MSKASEYVAKYGWVAGVVTLIVIFALAAYNMDVFQALWQLLAQTQ